MLALGLFAAVLCSPQERSASEASASAAEARRPNILFAIADDWGWPHAGACGDAVVRTPTFDRLAAEGVLFESAFVSSPSCTPSRNAILTGQHFFRLGEGANLWSTLAPEHATFPLLLEDAGYHVGHWRKAWGPGKWQALGRERNPAGRRYRSVDEFFAARPEGAPFCFWLGSSDPHRGYEEGSGAESGIDLAAIEVPPPFPDSAEVRGDIADYYFEVQRFDRDVGRALERLEEMGELENTIVVMTGDHGWPFPRGKTNLYDLGSRVPLAVRWGASGPSSRSVVSELVSLVDLAPTLLARAGVAAPEAMTGTDLWPLITGELSPAWGRRGVVLGRERHTRAQPDGEGGYPSRGWRTAEWLYVRNLEPDRWPAGSDESRDWPFRDCDRGPAKQFLLDHREEHAAAFALCFGKRPGEELYDLREDPWQVTNVASDAAFAAVKRRLAAELDARLARLEDPRVAGAGADFDAVPYRR